MAKKRKSRVAVTTVGPTPEQCGQGEFESALLACKRVVAIKRLKESGTLTQRQYDALDRYRAVAIAEERSPMRDSLDKALHGRGGGEGLPPSAMRVTYELGRLEQALGSLRDIARAIAVDDMTLSQWAMKQSGAIQREKPGCGLNIITWFEPRRLAMKNATMDIRTAGERLAAEIGA